MVDANCWEYVKKLSNPSVTIVESSFRTASTTRSACESRPRRSTFSCIACAKANLPRIDKREIRWVSSHSVGLIKLNHRALE
jgi:hypothetical protein